MKPGHRNGGVWLRALDPDSGKIVYVMALKHLSAATVAYRSFPDFDGLLLVRTRQGDVREAVQWLVDELDTNSHVLTLLPTVAASSQLSLRVH